MCHATQDAVMGCRTRKWLGIWRKASEDIWEALRAARRLALEDQPWEAEPLMDDMLVHAVQDFKKPTSAGALEWAPPEILELDPEARVPFLALRVEMEATVTVPALEVLNLLCCLGKHSGGKRLVSFG